MERPKRRMTNPWEQHLNLGESGLTMKQNKCIYHLPQLAFFGYLFLADGMPPNPSKVQEIIHLDTPSTVSEVQSFLGMANYCQRFIPNHETTQIANTTGNTLPNGLIANSTPDNKSKKPWQKPQQQLTLTQTKEQRFW